MSRYVIVGGKRLTGNVKIESAKNAVLPLLAGAILTDEDVVIKNCPKIHDVLSMIKILKKLGCKAEFFDDNLLINSSTINSYTIPSVLTKELRSSIFMLGALISRLKKARISYPGGCEIGLRPIDIHLSALRKLGVDVTDVSGEIICLAHNIKCDEVYLDFPSVGATENIILASVFNHGETVIRNSAKEPEIEDLIKFLNSMGAKITGGGSETIRIQGVKTLHGTEYLPMPDRIEAGTFLISALMTGGDIEIHNCKHENILSIIHKFCNNTCKIDTFNDIIHVKGERHLKSFSLTTSPYPGFPTDMQAQAMALATISVGTSFITENIFEMRFKHASELRKMGADITLCGRMAIVNGVKALSGAEVFAEDLRGGASLVLAGLSADGQTIVNDIHHIERGYLDMDKKLRSLGADIVKIE